MLWSRVEELEREKLQWQAELEKALAAQVELQQKWHAEREQLQKAMQNMEHRLEWMSKDMERSNRLRFAAEARLRPAPVLR